MFLNKTYIQYAWEHNIKKKFYLFEFFRLNKF